MCVCMCGIGILKEYVCVYHVVSVVCVCVGYGDEECVCVCCEDVVCVGCECGVCVLCGIGGYV